MSAEMLLVIAVFAGALTAYVSLALAIGNPGGGARQRARHRLERVAGALPAGRSAGRSAAAPAIRLRDGAPGNGFARWLARTLPGRRALVRRLERTGKKISLSHFVLASMALALIAAAAGAFLIDIPVPLALGAGAGVGIALPRLIVGRLIARRTKAFLGGFPDAIDVVVRSVKSGLPVSEAIRTLAEEFPAPIGSEFSAIADAMKLGRSMEEAMWQAADRLEIPEFNFFVISLSVQRETGGNLAETLGNLADILRRRHQMKLKIKAMSSEARASALVLGALPFGIFALLFIVSPDYVLRLFDDPRGLTLLGAGLASQLVGFAVMLKMARFET